MGPHPYPPMGKRGGERPDTVWQHLEPRKGLGASSSHQEVTLGGWEEARRPRSQAKQVQVGCWPTMLWLAPFHLMGFQEGFFKARA